MIRKIIHIDEEKCNGCGACATACHEGAIGMVNGKAKLLRDDYCDGLGDCLPSCPTGAITFVEREAKAYDFISQTLKKRDTAKFLTLAASLFYCFTFLGDSLILVIFFFVLLFFELFLFFILL